MNVIQGVFFVLFLKFFLKTAANAKLGPEVAAVLVRMKVGWWMRRGIWSRGGCWGWLPGRSKTKDQQRRLRPGEEGDASLGPLVHPLVFTWPKQGM